MILGLYVFRALGIGHRVLGIGHWALGIGHRALAIGHWATPPKGGMEQEIQRNNQ